MKLKFIKYYLKYIEKLFQRVDDRLIKAEQALSNGKFQAAAGLLKSVQALENNAKHLVADRDWKEKMEKAKADIKINRVFSDRAQRAIKAKTASSSWEELNQVGKEIENGKMASSTRQWLRDKIRTLREQMKPGLDQEIKDQPAARPEIRQKIKKTGLEIKIAPRP